MAHSGQYSTIRSISEILEGSTLSTPFTSTKGNEANSVQFLFSFSDELSGKNPEFLSGLFEFMQNSSLGGGVGEQRWSLNVESKNVE